MAVAVLVVFLVLRRRRKTPAEEGTEPNFIFSSAYEAPRDGILQPGGTAGVNDKSEYNNPLAADDSEVSWTAARVSPTRGRADKGREGGARRGGRC